MTTKANTTNSNFRSKTFLTLLFLFSASFNASASIIYELSTDDIANWEGEYEYYDSSESDDVKVFVATGSSMPSELLSSSTSSFTLTTNYFPDTDDEAWYVGLFRTLGLMAVSGPEKLFLTVEFDSDITGDDSLASAYFETNDRFSYWDLVSGTTIDITEAAGKSVLFGFQIESVDSDLLDTLNVTQIKIEKIAQEVSAPPTLSLLLLISLLGIRRLKK
tara:strand:- start:4309 stop:4965 length:657 start_codon:yes stop_codon:yes gene_type:complete